MEWIAIGIMLLLLYGLVHDYGQLKDRVAKLERMIDDLE